MDKNITGYTEFPSGKQRNKQKQGTGIETSRKNFRLDGWDCPCQGDI